MLRFWSMVQQSRRPIGVRTVAPISSKKGRHDDDDEDCPVCEEYTAGPCGAEFQQWLDCSNRHEDDYETKCETQFIAFQKCFERKMREGLGPPPPPDETDF